MSKSVGLVNGIITKALMMDGYVLMRIVDTAPIGQNTTIRARSGRGNNDQQATPLSTMRIPRRKHRRGASTVQPLRVGDRR